MRSKNVIEEKFILHIMDLSFFVYNYQLSILSIQYTSDGNINKEVEKQIIKEKRIDETKKRKHVYTK